MPKDGVKMIPIGIFLRSPCAPWKEWNAERVRSGHFGSRHVGAEARRSPEERKRTRKTGEAVIQDRNLSRSVISYWVSSKVHEHKESGTGVEEQRQKPPTRSRSNASLHSLG